MSRAILAAIAIAVAGILVAATGGAAAAQPSCGDDFGQFDVSKADEPNVAIDCFNSAIFDDEPAGIAVADMNDDGQVRLDDVLLLAQQVAAG